jgi:hypothetical protein
LLAQEDAQKAENKAPLMVSFTDLKWVELPERKGMQFALLSGDPKPGPTRRFAEFLAALTTRYTPTAARSRT